MSFAVIRFRTYASFVKLEHTIFSLPLVFSGLLLHTRNWPPAHTLLLVLVAAGSGRVLAMGLNRIIDAEIDARNPRTKARELPRGAMRKSEAWAIVVASGFVYVLSAWMIAPICLLLSPLPVILFTIYPYLKRFTSLCHLGLGLAWSMAPVGGWLAGSQSLEDIGEIGWLWFFSVLWVAGFDIIYATMDEDFDRQAGLHSLPAKLGRPQALRIATLLHGIAFLSLIALWYYQRHTLGSLLWLVGIAVLFIWQHKIADRRPALAFFQLNGALGFLVLAMVLAGRIG